MWDRFSICQQCPPSLVARLLFSHQSTEWVLNPQPRIHNPRPRTTQPVLGFKDLSNTRVIGKGTNMHQKGSNLDKRLIKRDRIPQRNMHTQHYIYQFLQSECC
jgi:hypothetical protein